MITFFHKPDRAGFGFACIMAILTCCDGSAQWKEQAAQLEPGWNAVFLEVDPVPNDPAAVFSGLPVESVCARKRRFETVRCVRNAGELTPEDPEWLVCLDAAGPQRQAPIFTNARFGP